MAQTLPAEANVITGVRPEALHLSDDPTSEGAFEGEVIVVEHLGKETNIYLSVGDDTELTAIVEGQPALSSGDTVTVDLPREAIHVFDEDTGQVYHNATHRSGQARFEASTQPGSAD
jgi:ABC-type sugar transport system ATPase subunit